MFPVVPSKPSFPHMEEEIIRFWKEHRVFEKILEKTKEGEPFVFYDGPPFATGTPHYGHLVAGTIKDVIPRYKTMKGKYVERRFWWDCHGVPIEAIVEKKMNLSSKKDIEEKVWVHEFNEECRRNVFLYTQEWRKFVERVGRWVDMDNDYKTMDSDFMESVWWVFHELYTRGYIYEDYRVVPYSVGMSTPLSNFEVSQGYALRQDKAITVKFRLVWKQNTYILAWTTTPWTLVANLWLAVGNDILYGEIYDRTTQENYIIALSRIQAYYKSEEEYTLISKYSGRELVGCEYIPLFDDFVCLQKNGKLPLWQEIGKGAFHIVASDHVSDTEGTGVVHIAPAYGEEDMEVGKKYHLGMVAHIDDHGYTQYLQGNNHMWVFDFNETVIGILKEKGALLKIETITHSYPHCWRTDIPLIYRAISAWYVRVEAFKNAMIELNRNIYWVPHHIQEGRFWKWLENARDWNISRSRYWGTPLPIWKSHDKKEEVCIGSKEDLYQKNKEIGQITKIIFLRHGRTFYNEEGKFDFHDRAKLNEDGKKQAQEIARIFKNETIDVVFCSPLSRCKETVEPLCNELGISYREVDALKEIQAPDIQDTVASCKNFTWDNGFWWWETVKQVYERVHAFMKEVLLTHAGKTILICGHGDSTYLARLALRFDHETDLKQEYNTRKYSSWLYLENNPKKYSIHALYGIDYVYSFTGKEMDLHKHYVDDIVLPSSSSRVYTSIGLLCDRKEKAFSLFEYLASRFKEKGANVTWCVLRDNSYDTLEKELSQWNIYNYESWCIAWTFTKYFLEYIVKEKISIKRLVILAPGIAWNDDLGEEYKQFVNECIVLHSWDDSFVPYQEGKEVARLLWAQLLSFYHQWHFENSYSYGMVQYVVEKWIPLRRIPEVLDCWFESGAMPYGQKHYPFNKKESLCLPADFIAEWVDQTRGWFYTLLALSCALFKKQPFCNVIVNGIVLAEDGKKMSKKLKNYTDPLELIETYSADAMRMYILSSPVVVAEDLRFSPSWVEEMVKKVLFPLWNAYYFFTTYANIDGYDPKKGRIYFIRHGQTDRNVFWSLGVYDEPLNDTGIREMHETAKMLQEEGVHIDRIVTSPMKRARESAEILHQYFPQAMLEIDPSFEEKNIKDAGIHSLYEERILKGYKELVSRYPDESICIVSHSGVFRVLHRYIFWNHGEVYQKTIHNAQCIPFPQAPYINPLDIWILSELHVFLETINQALEKYLLQDATKLFIAFLENLTNWYIRRSRRRFWKSERDEDKKQAYDTLYEVLLSLCKAWAPFIPFITEYIYKWLTGNFSVHALSYPYAKDPYIFPSLNRKMQQVKQIVSLGLSARSRAKIRVRQPLSYVKVFAFLEEEYKRMIQEELNVKEVRAFEEHELPKKICRPYAHIIWPKFWKKTQEILQLAKQGNFVLHENGNVSVAGVELVPGEYEIAYVCESSVDEKYEILEADGENVIALNTNVTEELFEEWIVRDVIRHVQEARKEANYYLDDRIFVSFSGSKELIPLLEKWKHMIEEETLSTMQEELFQVDYTKECEIDEWKLSIQLFKK